MPVNNVIRTAVFVDFDNLFISLKDLDESIADQFANNPDRWMKWLEEKLPYNHLGGRNDGQRRVLVRKCYLNPQAFAKFRPYFIRNAFEVVDCPPLTFGGKTSTDIHMVIDIIDTLGDYPHLDEFILLSGDADFTPVLLRLRKNDKRTVVVSVGYVSPAYRTACDHIVLRDDFIQSALGVEYTEDESPELPRPERGERAQGVSEALLKKMAAALKKQAAEPGGIEAHMLPAVYKEFPEFRNSTHWLGYYSLRKLTEALVERVEGVSILEHDPWLVVLSVAEEPAAVPAAGVVSGPGALAASGDVPTQPVPAAGPGPRETDFSQRYPDLAPLAQKVHQLTDTPYLLPDEFQLIFEEIAREVNEAGFQLTRTSKTVRDRCVEKGAPIARAHVNFVLMGLQYSGYRFEPGEETAGRIAEAFSRNVLTLCRTAQLMLEPQDEQLLQTWFSAVA